MAEHLVKKTNASPFSTHIITTFPDIDVAKIRQLRNQYRNCFKHAVTRDGVERKDEELLSRFSDQHNDHALFIGWYDLALATGQMPIEAQCFEAWYFSMYPEKLNPAYLSKSHLPQPTRVAPCSAKRTATGAY